MINLEINVPYKAKEFFMEVIGEEPKKSVNSKNRQLRLAEEKCDFYTTGKGRGMKYIITEIYSQQKMKLKGKYAEDMKTVLIYKLQNNNRRIVLPKNVLMKECGFINEKYLDATYNKKKTAEELEVMLSSVVLFCNTVDKLLGQAIKRNLNYLVDASYIIAKPKKKCKFTVIERELDKNGKIKFVNGLPERNRFNRYMLMDEEQEEFLSGAIRVALNEYNFEKQSDVFKANMGIQNMYYNKIKELISNRMVNDFTNNILLKDENIGVNVEYEVKFDYYYDVYDIRANEYIADFKISEEEYNKALKNINEMSIISIKESLNNNKTKDKRCSDINSLNFMFNEESNIVRLLEDSSQLTDKLIKI
nr:hypothetical protein [uncultured Romboutsia sp.]